MKNIDQHYGDNLRRELLKIRGIGSETADVLLPSISLKVSSLFPIVIRDVCIVVRLRPYRKL